MDADIAEDLSVFDVYVNQCPNCGRVRLRGSQEPPVHGLCPECIDRSLDTYRDRT